MMRSPVLGRPAAVVHGDGAAPTPSLLVSTETQPKTVFPSLSRSIRVAFLPAKRLAESVHWLLAAFAVTEALAEPTPGRLQSGDVATGTLKWGQSPEAAEATGACVLTMPNAAAAMREKSCFMAAFFVVMGTTHGGLGPPRE